MSLVAALLKLPAVPDIIARAVVNCNNVVGEALCNWGTVGLLVVTNVFVTELKFALNSCGLTPPLAFLMSSLLACLIVSFMIICAIFPTTGWIPELIPGPAVMITVVEVVWFVLDRFRYCGWAFYFSSNYYVQGPIKTVGYSLVEFRLLVGLLWLSSAVSAVPQLIRPRSVLSSFLFVLPLLQHPFQNSKFFFFFIIYFILENPRKSSSSSSKSSSSSSFSLLRSRLFVPAVPLLRSRFLSPFPPLLLSYPCPVSSSCFGEMYV